jgi:hypothetical protein
VTLVAREKFSHRPLGLSLGLRTQICLAIETSHPHRIDQIGIESEDELATPHRLRPLGSQAPTSYIPEEALSVVGEGFEMALPEIPDWPVVLKTVPRRMVRSFGEKCVLQAL